MAEKLSKLLGSDVARRARERWTGLRKEKLATLLVESALPQSAAILAARGERGQELSEALRADTEEAEVASHDLEDGVKRTLANMRREVARDLEALQGLAGLAEVREELQELEADLARQLERVRGAAVVTLVGATGAGKSTLLNALVGQPIAVEGESRPTTRAPVVYRPVDADLSRLLADLPGEDPVVVDYEPELGGPLARPDPDRRTGHQQRGRRAPRDRAFARGPLRRPGGGRAPPVDRGTFHGRFRRRLRGSARDDLRAQPGRRADGGSALEARTAGARAGHGALARPGCAGDRHQRPVGQDPSRRRRLAWS